MEKGLSLRIEINKSNDNWANSFTLFCGKKPLLKVAPSKDIAFAFASDTRFLLYAYFFDCLSFVELTNNLIEIEISQQEAFRVIEQVECYQQIVEDYRASHWELKGKPLKEIRTILENYGRSESDIRAAIQA